MMKRRAALLILFIALAGSLSALDFGATIDNASSYGNAQIPAFTQLDRMSAWLTTGIGQYLKFSAAGSATISNGSLVTGTTLPAGTPIAYLIDLNTFSLAGEFPKVPSGPSLLDFTLGRFSLSDFTGFVYAQDIDGFQLAFSYPGVVITSSLGYTGLTLKPSSEIVLTKADAAALTNSADYLGSPRVVGELNLYFPGLFLRQDLTLAALFQEDLRPLFANDLVQPGTTALSPSQGGSLDSQYFEAGLSGPIAKSLYYSGFFVLESGRMLSYVASSGDYEYSPILAFLGGGGLRYYASGNLSPVVGLDVNYASGDADFTSALEGNSAGSATAFQPITTVPLALVFSPNLENVVTGSLSFSLKPLGWLNSAVAKNVQTTLKAIPFLRATAGPVSTPGVSPASKDLYLGSEVDFVANYRPFSDLGIDLQVGVFVPSTAGVFVTGQDSPQYLGKLDFSFSF